MKFFLVCFLLVGLVGGQITLNQQVVVTVNPAATSPTASTAVASPTSVIDNGIATATITVSLNDEYLNPEPSKSVTLASNRTGGLDVISAPSGSSSASGIVTFTVKSNYSGVAAFTVTDVTDSNLVLAVPVYVSFSSVSALLSNVSFSPASVTANGGQIITVLVTLVDIFNNTVPGKTVTLTSSRGAVDTISPSSAVTNSSGLALFFVTSQTAGSPVLTVTDASDNSLVLLHTAQPSFVAGAVSASQSTVSPGSSSITAGASTIITVVFNDAYNNPRSGKTASLSSSRGDVITPVSGTTSSSSGVVQFTVSNTVAGTSVFTATDTSDGNLVITQTASVTYVAGPEDASHSTQTASSNPNIAGVPFTVTVTIVDQYNNPIGGKTPFLHSSRGAVDTISAPSPSTTQASNGQSVFTVTTTTAGTIQFTAGTTN